MPQQYNQGNGTPPSSIGNQIRTDFYIKKALKEARKKQYISQLAMTQYMPKHYGKEIKKDHYIPIIHDANIGDQGIDANGLTITRSVTIIISYPGVDDFMVNEYAVGEGATATAALTAAQARAEDIFKRLGVFDTDYATTKTALIAGGWTITDTGADVPVGQNLYGSSKDVGNVSSKFPVLSEGAGRVNRVGMSRITKTGTLERFGFHISYTDEAIWFDTDAQYMQHMTREMLNAAYDISEKLVVKDVLNGAGNKRFAGTAISKATMTGEVGATASVVSYDDLLKASIDLDNKYCPKQTKIITGSRNIDTKTLAAARVAYIPSALEPTIRSLKNSFNEPAFVDLHKYAGATTPLNGEIGAIDQFRFVVHPEMLYWEGAGVSVNTNDGYRENNGKYNVYPILIVGDDSFTTIGFQTSSKSKKFKLAHKKPGKNTITPDNPYGNKGVMSIDFFYGSLIDRPERITVLHTLAKS